ncbi:uncharacterized protein LOC144139881 [Haemaphysalis longicornis]
MGNARLAADAENPGPKNLVVRGGLMVAMSRIDTWGRCGCSETARAGDSTKRINLVAAIPAEPRGTVDVPRTTTYLYCKKIVKVSNMERHLQACSKRQVALESTDLTKDAKRGTAKARNVTFLMQAGVVREMVTIDSRNANIDSLKEVACNMILTKRVAGTKHVVANLV